MEGDPLPAPPPLTPAQCQAYLADVRFHEAIETWTPFIVIWGLLFLLIISYRIVKARAHQDNALE